MGFQHISWIVARGVDTTGTASDNYRICEVPGWIQAIDISEGLDDGP